MRSLIKIFRIFLWLACLLLITLGIAYATLGFIFSEHRVIKMIEDGCRGYTQRECRLDHFRWSIFSGIRAGGCALSEPIDFTYGEAFSFKELRFTLDLSSLIHRRFRVGSLTLFSPRLNLFRSREGQWNYADLSRMSLARPAAGQYASSAAPAVLLLSRVSITDAEVNYQDRAAGELFQVRGLNIAASDVSGLRPFDMRLSFTLRRGDREYACAGTIRVDPINKALSVAQGTVDMGSERMELAGSVTLPGDAADTAFDLRLKGSSKIIDSFTGPSLWSPVIRFFQGDTADVSITGTPGKIKVAFNRGGKKS